MNYSDALAFLYQQLPMYQRVGQAAFKKDLTNVRILLQKLGEPQRRFPSVHVAGTNGKGSSAHYLAAILQSAGYRTGLYTSPHLKSFTERIRVDGQEIGEVAVVRFVQDYQTLLEEVQPSFFEVTVAMAFRYFAQQSVDIAVVEVGLGGRLDSTNVIVPEVSLITNIGYDHTDLLGDTLAQIAYEKAGIIKAAVPVVIGQHQAETTPVFERVAHEQAAPLVFAEEEYRVDATQDTTEGLRLRVADLRRRESVTLTSSLRGWYQATNVVGVLATVDQLRARGWSVLAEHVAAGLANVQSLTGLRGRWQVLHHRPLCIADTGHNAEAWREIVRQLQTYEVTRYHFVLGVVQGKDLTELLRILPKNGIYYFCQASVPRALPAATLAAEARNASLVGEVIENVQQAYERARAQAQPDDLIFIGGSSFVVAELEDL